MEVCKSLSVDVLLCTLVNSCNLDKGPQNSFIGVSSLISLMLQSLGLVSVMAPHEFFMQCWLHHKISLFKEDTLYYHNGRTEHLVLLLFLFSIRTVFSVFFLVSCQHQQPFSYCCFTVANTTHTLKCSEPSLTISCECGQKRTYSHNY